MLLEMTCATALCFAPELNLYNTSAQGEKSDVRWPGPLATTHFVDARDIILSTGTPVRYLTVSEQLALDRALLRTVKIVHKGRLLTT